MAVEDRPAAVPDGRAHSGPVARQRLDVRVRGDLAECSRRAVQRPVLSWSLLTRKLYSDGAKKVLVDRTAVQESAEQATCAPESCIAEGRPSGKRGMAARAQLRPPSSVQKTTDSDWVPREPGAPREPTATQLVQAEQLSCERDEAPAGAGRSRQDRPPSALASTAALGDA